MTFQYGRVLTNEERDALKWLASHGKTRLLVNLDGLLDDVSSATEEELLAAHVEALLARYVAMRREEGLAELRALGEAVIAATPEQQAQIGPHLEQIKTILGVEDGGNKG